MDYAIFSVTITKRDFVIEKRIAQNTPNVYQTPLPSVQT